MRNLKLLRSLRSSELQGPGTPQHLSVRTDTGSLLLASQFSVTEFDPRTGQVLIEVSLTADGFLPEDGGGSVVGLQDLAEQEAVCVATAGGDVILCNLNTNQLECVGSVDSGLTSMSWSPDEELVILTTGQETIIMMTKDFEPISEVGIHQDDFGEGKFITVGWGKKETQFHGSEGKQAAQRKTLEVQPAVSWDDRRPRVTWRGDGQLFAVSAVCPQTGARKVRVWSRECVLQATSETVNGLEQALCWKPSGSLIASTQRQPNKHSVVFMEKNGLLHGDFTLPFSRDEAQVKELLWNSDSTVLAVWLESAAGEDKRVETHIQLWTVGNFHWYLKQSLSFGSEAGRAPACVLWDPERPLRLHVATCGWTALTYDWSWCTERSAGPDASDNAAVAVIDGDKVLVTTFRQCVVPPPMCSFDLQLTSPVNQVTFLCQPQRTNQLAALTADGQISVYRPGAEGPSDKAAGGFRTTSPPLVLQRTYRLSVQQSAPLALRQLLWLQEDLFVAVSSGLQPTSSTLLLLRPEEDGDTHTLTVSSQVEVPGVVVGLVHGAQSRAVGVQLEDGQTRRLLWDGPEPEVVDWLDSSGCSVSFPVSCVQTALCSIDGEEILLGLTDRSHLYAGDTQLASNVSSFVVYDDFLILTTHSHTCRCLQLSTLSVKGLQAALASDGGQNDETLRRVERGSRIVTVVPQDTRLILQMPRGNLETVHHRALVLAQLRKWLDSLRFRDAFECMRKLRINLNLMYDHNPQVFLENVQSFITQLDSVSHINLFLTELREEDTSRTMYARPDSGSAHMPPPPPASKKKVDVVCDALRSGMEALDLHRFCLSILTSHVKKTVPELEIALQKVHELRVNPPGVPGAVSAEEALKYLLFLVNVNELYEHSLGTYDFDLVLMVAEKSQKDPKEYLPFLNMLKSLEPNYQRFTIDKHLRRFRKALQHLSKCGEERFPEALQLVKEQKLYSEALRLYPAGSAQHKALSCAYAEHLIEHHQAEQAGLLLWRCGEPADALQAFVSSSSWKNAVCAAQQIPLPPPQLALLARQLAEKLMEQRRFSDAALLLDQYAKDCEEAIAALITGALWEEALRLIHMHGRQDITETDLKPALLEACSSQLSFLEAQAATFSRHRARLAAVREQKQKARLELLDEDVADCADAELFSEASSVMSNSRYSHSNSRISSRSSKNRRKAERKKLSLKEGSPLEDRALLYALSDIITSVDKMREEVHSLLKALVLFQFDGQAEKLQLAYEEALQSMEAALPEVWQDGLQQSPAPVTGPNSTANSITASFNQKPAATQQDAEILTPPKMRNSVKWKLAVLN